MRDPTRPGHAALRRGRVSAPGQVYHLVTNTVDRIRVFSHFDAACAAARCFEAPHLLGDSRMLAWVLMPDHAHWLVQLGPEDNLGRLVNRLKSASAREANRELKRSGTLWARAFYDRALHSESDVRTVVRYIVANPLRAGLVARIGDYPFWNTIWVPRARPAYT